MVTWNELSPGLVDFEVERPRFFLPSPCSLSGSASTLDGDRCSEIGVDNIGAIECLGLGISPMGNIGGNGRGEGSSSRSLCIVVSKPPISPIVIFVVPLFGAGSFRGAKISPFLNASLFLFSISALDGLPRFFVGAAAWPGSKGENF